MIRDPNSYGYREEYDGAALEEIIDMAVKDVIRDKLNDFIRVHGKTIPGGDFSDFSCNVWSMIKKAIMTGYQIKELELKAYGGMLDSEWIDAANEFKWNGYIMLGNSIEPRL